MKLPFPLVLLAVVAVWAEIGLSASNAGGGAQVRPVVLRRPVLTAKKHLSGPKALPAGWSYVASARGTRLTLYRSWRSRHVVAQLSNPTAMGMPVKLLVKHIRAHWVETYLPMRPNGIVGWAPRSATRLGKTAWALTVHLRQHRLVVA